MLMVLLALLPGCASRPDLARLYDSAGLDAEQPPVIVIPGLAGSTLVDSRTGKQFWPGSLGTLAFSNYADLAQISAKERAGDGLVPGALINGVAGVDFYADLLHSLETVGRFKPGVPGQPVASGDRRRYYVLLYDWRKDNVEAVLKLHALVEQIRRDYAVPNLRVDIIAHSNGGLIANYYLRYGPRDVLESGEFTPWAEGERRIRRLVMLGAPNLGAATSLERLNYGTRMALRTVPVEVMATFATPFQTLPHPLLRPLLDASGKPLDLDIYDPQLWRQRQWSVFAPDVVDRVRASMPLPADGDRAVADLQATFIHNLHRGERMQLALSAPLPATSVEVAVFGGDCEPTPDRAVLLEDARGSRLVFRPAQVDPNRIGEPRKHRDPVLSRLMSEPGDGMVTRNSQVAREPVAAGHTAAELHMLPVSQSFFLCESHGRLTHNLYFQNNLLYFLLSR